MAQYDQDSLVVQVGTRIRALRMERGLSLRAFGKLADVHPFHVMAIELGQVAANATTLGFIAKALDVRVADLLIDTDGDLGAILEALRRDPSAVPTVRERVRKLVEN